MKAKSLAHWTELFKVADSPWLRSDWDAVLNIVCKLLSMTNALDDAKNESIADGTANFNKIFTLAQLYFGVPRLIVICDTKQTIGENQLAIITILHALKYSTSMIDSRRIRAVFAAQSVVEYPAFNLEVDDSSRYCLRCGSQVALVERTFVEGAVWHRSCLKCYVCKRQLSPGAFTFIQDGKRMECVEHFANRVLFGDAMHCIEPKRPTISTVTSPNASLTKVISPPPRPPPPRKVISPQSSDSIADSQLKDGIYESEKKKKPLSVRKISTKSSPHSSEKNWEVVYPTELNPFGSENEDDESHQFDLDFDESGKTSLSNNPFSDDSDDDKAGSDLEEVENPSDRVVSSNDNFSSLKYDCTRRFSGIDDSKSCQSIIMPPPSVTSPIPKQRNSILNKSKAMEKEQDEERDDENNPFTRSDATIRADDEERTGIDQFTPSKPPRAVNPIAKSTSATDLERRYVPPDLIFHGKKSKLICGTTFYELSIQLRKLNCQIAQIETTGKRLETQILRNVSSGRFEWKKCKTVDEYLKIIEKKCDAFRIENTLVHEYINTFVDETHAEVEKQLKELQASDNARRSELEKLLATLLDIKNTLIIHSQQLAPLVALNNNDHSILKTSSPADACRSLKKFSSPSLLKKGVKQTMKSLKKKL